MTALTDRPIALRSCWWSGAIRAFLKLMFAGRDKSAAQLIRR
jgi:hypothetical protein